MKSNVILLILHILSWTSLYGQITGRVTSESGEPIAGARVCVTTWLCAETNASGLYQIDPAGYRVIRVSFPGYRPVTRPVLNPSERINMILGEAEDAQWSLPLCTNKGDGRKGKRVGKSLQIVVPKGTRLKKGRDADYWTVYVGYGPSEGREWLRLGGGSTWGTGIPRQYEFFSEITITRDRDLVYPARSAVDEERPSIDGVDITATHKDGKRWRKVGDAFENRQLSPCFFRCCRLL